MSDFKARNALLLIGKGLTSNSQFWQDGLNNSSEEQQ